MNRIEPVACELVQCEVVEDQQLIAERYQELLGDESKLAAENVRAIYFPESVPEVCWAIREICKRGESCVVSAGRTGIAGGAVPQKAQALLSLERMKRPLALGHDGETFYVRAEPGLSLASLTGMLMNTDVMRCAEPTVEEQRSQQMIVDDKVRLWLPVNPTETSAHLGGIVATNASGSRSFRWGAARDWVKGLSVVLSDGRLLNINRGDIYADNGEFLLVQPDGSTTRIPIPEVVLPKTKATLGYPLSPGMDLIDLFIGSEGTLGIVVEVKLALAVRPQSTVGIMVLPDSEERALDLVELVRSENGLCCDAIEYFDQGALQLLREKKQADGSASHIPELPHWQGHGVYLEVSGTEEETEGACVMLESILERLELSLEDTWAAMESYELAAQRVFRHAVPEVVNAIIGQRKATIPELHKVGTDMAVPDQCLRELFVMYREGIAALAVDAVIFGHIGNNHLHVNLLPKSLNELAAAKAIYEQWAEKVVTMGGAVAAEHGIGRLKKTMLKLQWGDQILHQMQQVKSRLDPSRVLAPGVLFDDSR